MSGVLYKNNAKVMKYLHVMTETGPKDCFHCYFGSFCTWYYYSTDLHGLWHVRIVWCRSWHLPIISWDTVSRSLKYFTFIIIGRLCKLRYTLELNRKNKFSNTTHVTIIYAIWRYVVCMYTKYWIFIYKYDRFSLFCQTNAWNKLLK